ncbi:MAG: GGDEF domain-containing protein [Methylorubrum populi]
MSLKRIETDHLPRTRPMRWLTASGPHVPDEVQARLVKDFMVPLRAGAVGVIGDGSLQLIAAIRHPDGPFLYLLGAGLLILGLRAAFDLARRQPGWGRRVPIDLYFLLGHLSLAVVGIGSALVFATGDPLLQILAPAIMMGIASGVTMRDNGAPRFLVVQILLCTVPMMVAIALSGQPLLSILLVHIPMFDAYVIAKVFELNRLHLASVLAERESERRAMRDVLTGLSNRAGLMEALTRNLQRRGAGPFSLLYLDLDGFKAVNDTYGHATGDLLLQAVAARIGETMPERCVAARLGGDEFVVLIPDCGDRTAAKLGTRLVAAVSRPYTVGAGTVQVGVSIGIACAGADLCPDELLARADAALYAAKAAGKGRCALAEAKADARLAA